MWADPPVGRSHRKPGRRHGKTTPKRKQRSVLGWAAAIGGLAGVAVSVYLFWGQSTPDRIASPAPAPAQKAPASKTPVPAVAPVPRRAPASRVQDQPTDDSKWKARTEAREQQLRAKAQQRFREHMEETQRLAGQPAPAANTTQSEPARTAQDPSAAPAGASSAGTAIPQAGIQAQPPEVTEPMLPEAVDRPAEPVSAPTAESAPSPIPAAPVSATPVESTPVAEPPIPAPEATIDPAASAPPAATQPLANPEPLPSADEVEPDVTEPAQPGASVPAPGATIEEPAADEAPGGNAGETMTVPPSAVDTGEADPPASL